MPDEIVIADDGSTVDTKELIDSFRDKISAPIVHVWQEDKGFRLSAIRNKAIIKATGDYLIFIDGDIILDPYFVYDHARMITPNTLSQGRRCDMTKEGTEELIAHQNILIGPFFDGIHVKKFRKRLKLLRLPIIPKLIYKFYKKEDSLAHTIGANFSFHKSDLLRVNGFDEDFIGWGYEDSDLVLRLLNNGVKRSFLKNCAIGYHMYHGENHRINGEENINLFLITKHLNENTTWCENGISKQQENS